LCVKPKSTSDVVGANTWLKRWAEGRKGEDGMTVHQGLILPGEWTIEEIWVGLSHKPISFSQESAGVGLRMPVCMRSRTGRLGNSIYPRIGPARQTAGRHGELGVSLRPIEAPIPQWDNRYRVRISAVHWPWVVVFPLCPINQGV
jgi:hypothetical protein